MDTIIFEGEQELSPIMKDIYRRVRTNIELTGLENRIICVTSCMKDDGKSTVSYQLARSFADKSKTVLFVDADMRNSSMLSRMGVNGKPLDLSQFLSGQVKLEQVIYKTSVPDFYFLPTGKFPAAPTELLSKPRFHNMIEKFRETFDYVFIDTPPIGAVVDSIVVAQECDGSVLVVPANTISRRVVADYAAQLRRANSNLLGVVLNKVDEKSGRYGYGYGYGRKYGYEYGYGYGYGYGAEYGHSDAAKEEK
ncbi:MAG: CpsD/CapB family tyrosine-protein kinase [Lachnospiraceae bacterium]|nr:CpsD/CapB family tyrosine-protein kinase [Lachnospiraceae bacterium]